MPERLQVVWATVTQSDDADPNFLQLRRRVPGHVEPLFVRVLIIGSEGSAGQAESGPSEEIPAVVPDHTNLVETTSGMIVVHPGRIPKMKIEAIATRWLRIPLSPPIADSTHILNAIDLILVDVTAGGVTGSCYMLSFDYAPALLKGFVDQELKRYLIGAEADDIRGVFERSMRVCEYV